MSIRKQFNLIPNTPNEVVAAHLEEALELAAHDPLLVEKLSKCLSLVEALDTYLVNNCSSESDLQKKIYQDTLTEPWEENYKNGLTSINLPIICLSGKVEGRFLQTMAEMTKAKTILEMGMFTGYSAVSFCQSNYVKEVTALELEPYLEKFVRARTAGTEVDKKLRILVGPAMDSLKILRNEGKKFDLIFIDADKVNYLNYYKFVMDNDLVEKDGSILIDNTLWKAEVYPPIKTERGNVLNSFNEYVQNDSRVSQVIVPLRDGVMLIKPKPIG
jgi:caffeoyl-CoA O-methyltransferase